MQKTLTGLTIEKNQILTSLRENKKSYEDKAVSLASDLYKVIFAESILTENMNLDAISTANTILETRGKITNNCEGRVLADAACVAISYNGLKEVCLGNKEYSTYYQQCDCEYGMGPKHGSVVESVGLSRDYRKVDLTDEQKDACIYYLKNFDKIMAIKVDSKEKRNAIVNPDHYTKK